MKRTRDILMALAVVLAFGLGALGCSGASGDYSRPSSMSSAHSRGPAMPTDTSTGPAHRMVSGKLVKIKGPYYDVVEYTGARMRLHVSNKTVMINGKKKVGDRVRVEITKGGHANSIQ